MLGQRRLGRRHPPLEGQPYGEGRDEEQEDEGGHHGRVRADALVRCIARLLA